jgi:hypothetical protein
LYGRVADQQGGVIPKALITLTRVQTGVVYTTNSNDVGEWQFSTIPVGEYNLKVQKEGFRALEQTGIVLQVNDNRRVDVSLMVGSVSTMVEVKAAAVAVNLSDRTLKGIIDNERALELPLNGRNLASLALLVPGVEPAGGVTGANGDGAKSAFSSLAYSIDGARQNTVSFMLDGGDNMDIMQNTMLPYPFPDAVQEFSVETTGTGAEFGRNQGGRMNVVTKSGTNGFHGDAFEFVRNTAFDANDFFSHGPDNLKQNQAGFTFGGPVKKNKLFFFGGYQQTWIRSASAAASSVTPPANVRQGDLSALLSGSKPLQLVDPLKGNAPYANNQIPSSEFDPVALTLLKYDPLPNASNNLYYWTQPSIMYAHEWVTRVDYNVTPKSNFYVRLYRNYDARKPNWINNNLNSASQGSIGSAQNATVAFNYTVSPTMLVQTRFTGNDYDGDRVYAVPFTNKDLGININPQGNGTGMSFSGTSGYSGIGSGDPAYFARASLEFAQSWQWIKGRHSVVWGANIEDSRYNENNDYNAAGSLHFNGEYTGYDFADFLIGQLSEFYQDDGEIEFRRLHYYGFYGGDTFRLTPRLTLTYGARWEPELPITDLNNRQNMWNQAAYNAGTVSQVFVNSPPGLLYVGDKGPSGNTIPKGVIPNNYRHITPRLGFAWDVFGDGKTSLRGGWGMYYDAPELYAYNNMNLQSPYSFTIDFTTSATGVGGIPFDNPYAGRQNLNVFPYAGNFQKNSAFSIPMTASALQTTQTLPYEQTWNLTVERQLRQNWIVTASYVGSKGTNLWGDYDDNPPPYNYSLTLAQNLATITARRPMGKYYQELDLLMAGLNQEYNGFELSIERRMARGLSNKSSYTLSKNLDYQSGNKQITTNTLWDPYNFFQFRGRSDYDRHHRFVDSVVYHVPDAGHAMKSHYASAITGNWQVSGIITLETGIPFTIMSSNNSCACGMKSTAKVVAPITIASGRGKEIAQYFSTSSFAQADPGTFGTLGRNTISAPNYLNTDAAAYRNFPLHFLGDQGKLTFRAEFFNLFNRPDLGAPGNKVGSSTFGKITSDQGPRILQFSLKLFF